MDHTRFKANHTAALYVNGELDEHGQETFELHLMSCPSCVQDVEIWRAMCGGLRRERRIMGGELGQPGATQTIPWRLAASFAAIAIGSGAAGWYGRTLTGPSLTEGSVAVFSLPPVTRGYEDCFQLQVTPATELIALRVPNSMAGWQLELTDPRGTPLDDESWSVRTQADGSWLLRMRARQTSELLRLQARAVDGASEPIACLVVADRS